MEQQRLERVEEDVNVDEVEYSKPNERAGMREKRESELESYPSTSTENSVEQASRLTDFNTAAVADGLIYSYKYVSKVLELPFKDMMSSTITRNMRLPKIYLTGRPFEISFLLDTSAIAERDLWVDNLGSWAGMRRRPTCKSIRVNEAGMPDTKNPYYVVKKKYGSHPHCEPPLGLMKCLSYLTRDGHPIGNAVLSYKCLENCRLQPRPHGNSKRRQNIPYMRTYPSTLMKVREQLNSRSPAAVWNELSMDSSGHSDVQAILRDRKQVYNARMPRRKSSGNKTNAGIAKWMAEEDAALMEPTGKVTDCMIEEPGMTYIWPVNHPETLDEINFLKSRLAALEEQNNKLIYTNASLMELVNDLRKSKEELEIENARIKQAARLDSTDGMMELPHSRLMAYSVQPVEHSTAADVYKQEAETQVRGRKRCVQECHLRNPSNVNQSTCFSAVPGHGY